MSGVATGISGTTLAILGGSALLSAGAGVAGAVIAGNASDTASKRYQEGEAANRAAMEADNARARQDQQPYAQAGMGGVQGLQGYQQTGQDALAQQRALAGLDGPEAQQAALAALEGSPQFAAMMQQSEEAILQNASATGGLRGGNVQGMLAQNRSGILASLIQQQYANLGGLAGAGQNAAGNIAQLGQGAAAGQAAGTLNAGQLAGQSFANQGNAAANAALAQGAAYQGGLNGVANAANTFAGQYGGMQAAGGGGLQGGGSYANARPYAANVGSLNLSNL